MTYDQTTTRMMPSVFQKGCRSLALEPLAFDFLATFRGSQPVRRVTSRANNVSGMYPISKMGVTIQLESHKVELWATFSTDSDHDPDVLEFYDQQHTFKLRYLRQLSQKMHDYYCTPDFLVLRKTFVYFEKWKTEADLKRLAALYPSRYQQMEDGSWRCLLKEEYTQPLEFEIPALDPPKRGRRKFRKQL